MDYFDILLAKKLSGGGGGGEITVEGLTVNDNGTYTAPSGKAYSPVVVQLPLGEKAITANGEYLASADDLKGYSKVTVAVEGYQTKALENVPADVASFNDGVALPMTKLKVSIVPVQSGSGDPSPSNPRPISGWSSVGVDVVGKNLFNENFSDYSTSVQYLYYGHLPKNQALNISFEDKDTSIDMSGIYVGFGYNYTTGSLTNYRWSLTNGVITTNLTNITNLGDYGNTIIIYPADETTFNKLKARYNVKITIGSAVESYVPYNGTTTPIPLGQTVYGGELDVTSGILKARPYYASYNGETLVGPWISSHDEYEEGATPTTGAQVVDLGGAETTYQLTPTQVSSILGTNNIWADCGDVISGKYFASL